MARALIRTAMHHLKPPERVSTYLWIVEDESGSGVVHAATLLLFCFVGIEAYAENGKPAEGLITRQNNSSIFPSERDHYVELFRDMWLDILNVQWPYSALRIDQKHKREFQLCPVKRGKMK